MTFLAQPGKSHADWIVGPRLQLDAEYVDNQRLSVTEDEETWAMIMDLSAAMTGETDYSRLTLIPRIRAGRYSVAKEFNKDEQFLDMKALTEGKNSVWKFDAAARRDWTLTSELAETGLTESNKRRDTRTVTPSVIWQTDQGAQFDLNMAFSDVSYRNAGATGLVDYSYGVLSLGLSRVLDEQSALGLSVSASRLEAPANFNKTTTDNVQVWIKAELNVYFSTRWVLGWRESEYVYDFSIVKFKDKERGWVAEVELNGRLEYFYVNTSVSRRVEPAGYGSLTEKDAFAAFISGSFSETLHGFVNVSLADNRELGETATERAWTYASANIGAERIISPAWSAGIKLVRQAVENRRTSTLTDSNALMFTLKYGDELPVFQVFN